MDEKDVVLLEKLKQNSNQSTRDLAKKTNIPITTVHKRIRKMQKEGIIKKYTIEINYEKIGKMIGAYILVTADLKELKNLNKTQYDMAKEIKKMSEVEDVFIILGGADLMVKVRVKDIAEFDNLLFSKIQHVEGVIHTQTMIVVHEGI